MKFPGINFTDVTDVVQVIILQKCHFLNVFVLDFYYSVTMENEI